MATIEQGAATGVSFALTDEQKALRELAREFAAKEIRPKAAEYDAKMQHPVDVIAKAHELGLMNLHVPESSTAAPASAASTACSSARSSTGAAPGIGTSLGANGLGAGPVIIAGTDEQKATWLAAAARGADPLLVRPLRAGRGLRRRAR